MHRAAPIETVSAKIAMVELAAALLAVEEAVIVTAVIGVTEATVENVGAATGSGIAIAVIAAEDVTIAAVMMVVALQDVTAIFSMIVEVIDGTTEAATGARSSQQWTGMKIFLRRIAAEVRVRRPRRGSRLLI